MKEAAEINILKLQHSMKNINKAKTYDFSWSQAAFPGPLNNSVWCSLSLLVVVIHSELLTGRLLPSVFHQTTPPADFVLLFICFMRPTVNSWVFYLTVHPLQLLLVFCFFLFSAPLKPTAWQALALSLLLHPLCSLWKPVQLIMRWWLLVAADGCFGLGSESGASFLSISPPQKICVLTSS